MWHTQDRSASTDFKTHRGGINVTHGANEIYEQINTDEKRVCDVSYILAGMEDVPLSGFVSSDSVIVRLRINPLGRASGSTGAENTAGALGRVRLSVTFNFMFDKDVREAEERMRGAGLRRRFLNYVHKENRNLASATSMKLPLDNFVGRMNRYYLYTHKTANDSSSSLTNRYNAEQVLAGDESVIKMGTSSATDKYFNEDLRNVQHARAIITSSGGGAPFSDKTEYRGLYAVDLGGRDFDALEEVNIEGITAPGDATNAYQLLEVWNQMVIKSDSFQMNPVRL